MDCLLNEVRLCYAAARQWLTLPVWCCSQWVSLNICHSVKSSLDLCLAPPIRGHYVHSANMMSSTKPKVHNVSQHHEKRTALSHRQQVLNISYIWWCLDIGNVLSVRTSDFVDITGGLRGVQGPHRPLLCQALCFYSYLQRNTLADSYQSIKAYEHHGLSVTVHSLLPTTMTFMFTARVIIISHVHRPSETRTDSHRGSLGVCRDHPPYFACRTWFPTGSVFCLC